MVELHYYGVTNQVQLLFYFSLFLVLLSNKVVHHWHFKYAPEPAAIILLGIVASILCRLGGSNAVAKPAGNTMKRHFFFENLHSILSFAILGTFVSNLTVGILLFVTGRIGLSVRLSIAECLTFGALISTTNPVSTLTIFQELPVDPTLLYVVFGESVLNDAVSIVLFTTFSKFIGYTYTLSSSIFALLDFGLIFVGSTFVGILFGLLLALLFKHFDFKKCTLHELLAHLPLARAFDRDHCLFEPGTHAVLAHERLPRGSDRLHHALLLPRLRRARVPDLAIPQQTARRAAVDQPPARALVQRAARHRRLRFGGVVPRRAPRGHRRDDDGDCAAHGVLHGRRHDLDARAAADRAADARAGARARQERAPRGPHEAAVV